MMSAPVPGLEAADQPAQALLTELPTIAVADGQKHESVLNYWLSIRGHRELPPLRDLDPLEISDAAPSSVLLELLGGGEDAEVRHLGEDLRAGGDVDRVSEAPRGSVLGCVARKLSAVAVSRNFLAFEDEFSGPDGPMRCWLTLLPLSSAGAWVDYIYGYVTVAPVEAGQEAPELADVAAVDAHDPEPVQAVGPPEKVLEETPPAEPEPEPEMVAEEPDGAEEAVLELDSPVEPEMIEDSVEEDVAADAIPTAVSGRAPGFTFDSSTGGFYASQPVKVKPTLPHVEAPQALAEEASTEVVAAPEHVNPVAELIAPAPVPEPVIEQPQPAATQDAPRDVTSAKEGSLQSKLTDVRVRADEARLAKLRANAALYEGLSAAYDFALDAEESPEEYLKLIEAQGLKIQLRSPMRPVVKLAFQGMCDDSTIAQLETVLAWALDQELPRGTLGKHIEEAGGIGPILSGLAKAA